MKSLCITPFFVILGSYMKIDLKKDTPVWDTLTNLRVAFRGKTYEVGVFGGKEHQWLGVVGVDPDLRPALRAHITNTTGIKTSSDDESHGVGLQPPATQAEYEAQLSTLQNLPAEAEVQTESGHLAIVGRLISGAAWRGKS